MPFAWVRKSREDYCARSCRPQIYQTECASLLSLRSGDRGQAALAPRHRVTSVGRAGWELLFPTDQARACGSRRFVNTPVGGIRAEL